MNSINFDFLSVSIRDEIDTVIYEMQDASRLMYGEELKFEDFTACIKNDNGRLLAAFLHVPTNSVEFYRYIDGYGLDFVDRLEASETFPTMLDGYIELIRYARKGDVK